MHCPRAAVAPASLPASSQKAGWKPALRNRGRLSLLLLMGLFALPPVLGWVGVHVWRPAPGAPHGQLLEPVEFRPAGLTTASGAPFDLMALRGRWVLLQAAGAGCAADCAQNLYLSRQARTAQGRERARIERVLLLPRTAAPPQDGELRLALDSAQTPSLPPGLYLIDPLGRLMMRYPPTPDGAALIRDLRRLLKASHIG